LLDLNLPRMSGLEAIPWFKKYAPEIKIIVLTQSDAEADILQAIQSGASGYLLKSSRPNQIIESIKTVMNGGASLDANVARFVLDTLKNKLPKEQPTTSLSKRELEVISLLADGLARKEIADQLKISKNTVIYHIKHIFVKLEAINTPAAISKAYRAGILPTGDYDDALGGGVSLGYFFDENFGVDFGAAWYATDSVVHNYTLDAVYRLPMDCIAPYIFGGGGVHSNSHTEVLWRLGAGVDFRMSDTMSLFADGAYTWVGGDVENYTIVRAGLRFAF
jgi:DNA-binding NarL/FixJ family response regulator